MVTASPRVSLPRKLSFPRLWIWAATTKTRLIRSSSSRTIVASFLSSLLLPVWLRHPCQSRSYQSPGTRRRQQCPWRICRHSTSAHRLYLHRPHYHYHCRQRRV
jgi:hypothetical protein